MGTKHCQQTSLRIQSEMLRSCRRPASHPEENEMKRSLLNIAIYAVVFSLTLGGAAFAFASAGLQTGPSGGPAPQNRPNRSFPAPAMVPGQPIETRPPEKTNDKPAFPDQTRAPYEPTAPFNVTTLTDKLRSPWSLAFLPDGKILITEKPGTMRIL